MRLSVTGRGLKLLLMVALIGTVGWVIYQLQYRPVQLVGVNRLVLQGWDRNATHTNTVVITETTEISELIGVLRLETKDPCACLHLHTVRFEMPGEVATASICDHCFDLVRDGKVVSYTMPSRFWKRVDERTGPVVP